MFVVALVACLPKVVVILIEGIGGSAQLFLVVVGKMGRACRWMYSGPGGLPGVVATHG